MTTYQQTVDENLKYMNTLAGEWRAVPVLGMADADNNGVTVKMPEFDFPKGYAEAPSMFKSAGSEAVCGLCGKTIKNVYWIQNDSKKWTLMVGSECVTHFEGGKSGAELANDARYVQNREAVQAFEAAKKALWKAFAVNVSLGYGRYQWTLQNADAKVLHYRMEKVLGKVKSGKDGYGENWTSDAAITRWVNKNTAEVAVIMAEMAVLLQLPEVKRIRERNLLEQISTKEKFIAQFPNCPADQKEMLAAMKTELAGMQKKVA